jgi:WD40 repeat protein
MEYASTLQSITMNPYTASLLPTYQSQEYRIAMQLMRITGNAEFIQNLNLNNHFDNFVSNRRKLDYLIGNNYFYNNIQNTISKAKFENGVDGRPVIHQALIRYHKDVMKMKGIGGVIGGKNQKVHEIETIPKIEIISEKLIEEKENNRNNIHNINNINNIKNLPNFSNFSPIETDDLIPSSNGIFDDLPSQSGSDVIICPPTPSTPGSRRRRNIALEINGEVDIQNNNDKFQNNYNCDHCNSFETRIQTINHNLHFTTTLPSGDIAHPISPDCNEFIPVPVIDDVCQYNLHDYFGKAELDPNYYFDQVNSQNDNDHQMEMDENNSLKKESKKISHHNISPDDDDDDDDDDNTDLDIPASYKTHKDWDPIMKRLKPPTSSSVGLKAQYHDSNLSYFASPFNNPNYHAKQQKPLYQTKVVKPYGVENNTTHLYYDINGKTVLPNPTKLAKLNALFNTHSLSTSNGSINPSNGNAQSIISQTFNNFGAGNGNCTNLPEMNKKIYQHCLEKKPIHISKRSGFKAWPIAILEAPEISNDYYLNVLDWGKTGHIALVLFRTIYLYNPLSEDVVEVGQTQDGIHPTAIKFSPSGERLAVGLNDGSVLIYNIMKLLNDKNEQNNGENSFETYFEYHQTRVDVIEWVNENSIITGGLDQRVIHTDLRCVFAGGVTDIGREKIGEVMSLGWNKYTNQIAVGTNDNVGVIFDLRCPLRPQFELIDHHAAVKTLKWSPHNPALLATGSGTFDRHLRLYDISQGRLLASQNTNNQISSVQWSFYSNELITTHGFSNNAIMFWDATTLAPLGEVTGHGGRILSGVLNPTQTCLVTASADETIRIWDFYQQERKDVKKQFFGEGIVGVGGLFDVSQCELHHEDEWALKQTREDYLDHQNELEEKWMNLEENKRDEKWRKKMENELGFWPLERKKMDTWKRTIHDDDYQKMKNSNGGSGNTPHGTPNKVKHGTPSKIGGRMR